MVTAYIDSTMTLVIPKVTERKTLFRNFSLMMLNKDNDAIDLIQECKIEIVSPSNNYTALQVVRKVTYQLQFFMFMYS